MENAGLGRLGGQALERGAEGIERLRHIRLSMGQRQVEFAIPLQNPFGAEYGVHMLLHGHILADDAAVIADIARGINHIE